MRRMASLPTRQVWSPDAVGTAPNAVPGRVRFPRTELGFSDRLLIPAQKI